MVKSALKLLKDPPDPNDDYREFLFRLIFKRSPSDDEGEAVVDRLEDILTAFETKELLQEHTHASGNFRFYCDNDRVDGTGRWQLREDPPQPWPQDYIPQANRPRLPWSSTAQYQEYWDPSTRIKMGPELGCLTGRSRRGHKIAITYDRQPAYVTYPGFPRALVYAATTFCDIGFSKPGFTSIDSVLRSTRLEDKRNPLDFLSAATGSLLHEFCHFPPFRLRDVRSPNYDRQRGRRSAYSWKDVQDIPSPWTSIQNVNNVVFFVILARLNALGWRLSAEGSGRRRGQLQRVGNPPSQEDSQF